MDGNFNDFVYFYCIISSVLCIFVHFLHSKWVERRTAVWGPSFGQQNTEFRTFQNRFFIGYLPCLFADSLQAPYLYYLYQSYGFLESQIAILYVCGLVTNVIFTIISVYLVQRTERKILCLGFIGLNSVSCLLKFSDNYPILLCSRVMDGVASSLLTAPFQEWYVHEHVTTFDFPKEWIPTTFRKVALINGYLAIAAGFLAEFSETTFKVTAFPFLMAIPILICAGYWVHINWDQNRLSSEVRPRFWAQFGRALRIIGENPQVFLLSSIQSLFESVIYMFVFLWTPIFLYLRTLMSVRPSFGGIYSAFMASVLLGTLINRLLSRKFAAVHLLNLSAALCFVSMALAVALLYPGGTSQLGFKVLLVLFCTYEMGVGLYFPAMQRLQKDILPSDDRVAVLSLFRIPLNIIAAGGLLIVEHSKNRLYGNWMILILCMVLLAMCCMASLLLGGMVRRNRPNVDHFVLQLNQPDDEEDEVFS